MSVMASTTVSTSPSATSDPQVLQGQQSAPRSWVGCHQTESSRSIAASSSGVPWTFGPLNHLRAETSQ